MVLPASPPRYPHYRDMYAPIAKGEEGWRVFALQRGIKADPTPDNVGVFTIGLERAVKRWQTNHDLYVDGVAGPATQLSVLLLAAKAADEKAGLAGGTSYGFAVYEGGSLLAATNWGTPGGVDCGPGMWRVNGPPCERAKLRHAFDPWVALRDAAQGVADRWDSYRSRNPGLGDRRALEAAVLFHNWPSGADQIVRNGQVSSPDKPALWAPKTVDADGQVTAWFSRDEWSHEYPRRILSYALP